ncbi:MAG: hypothetical protein IJL59_04450 [Clostridia bacterium]|nr:hypothetical protein [Clostridia bacterium]
MKKLTLAMALVLLLAALLGCSGGQDTDTDADTLALSWWIPAGADTSYYTTYEENPCMKYIEQTMTFNGQKVDLTFLVPAAGAELDNFNTLLATEEYADILDLSRSKMSASELYEDGILRDLTPYIEQYMPNYMAALNASPELKSYVISDGKYLALYGIRETAQSNFMGFLYRRDWVAKYGKNPVTGEPFTYGFGEAKNAQTWTDNVVFPSGGSEPIYISDWEWMFDIFQTAINDLGITDGYCYAPYFKGYNEDGLFYSGFGGGTPMWYRTADNHAAFGGGSDNLRAYLQCMNTWYENGWLDKQFAERTTDLVYSINSAGVHTGKVGLWLGRTGEVGTLMDVGDEWTSGIMVVGAKPPINDLYGSDAQKNKEPDSMYQMSRLSQPIAVTNKVTDEELPTVLSFLDSFYAEEGGILLAIGMNAEQAAATDDDFYARFGLTDGAYTVETGADGSKTIHIAKTLLDDSQLGNAAALTRLSTGLWTSEVVAAKEESYSPEAQDAHRVWDFYKNIGFPDSLIRARFSVDESNTYNKVYANLDTYMSSQLPQFITGKLDIDSDEAWNSYCKMLKKYGPDKVTDLYEKLFAE